MTNFPGYFRKAMPSSTIRSTASAMDRADPVTGADRGRPLESDHVSRARSSLWPCSTQTLTTRTVKGSLEDLTMELSRFSRHSNVTAPSIHPRAGGQYARHPSATGQKHPCRE